MQMNSPDPGNIGDSNAHPEKQALQSRLASPYLYIYIHIHIRNNEKENGNIWKPVRYCILRIILGY